jgi:peptidoglycan/LPS O-acetylase OafA/YrhL
MSEKHIPALDGVRGLAVLTVVIYHAGGGAQSSNLMVRIFGTAIQIGWTGVTLFFILSGFLITGILWESRGAPNWYRNFYMRRTVRIVPLYYLALLIVMAGAFVLGNPRDIASHLWIYSLYLQNIPHFAMIGANLNSPFKLFHFWSLAVEEQFYLIWPFLLLRVRSTVQMKHLCAITFLLSLAFRIVMWWGLGDEGVSGEMLFARAGELALGAWIAMSYRQPGWRKVAPILSRLTPLFLLAFLATCLPGHSLRFQQKWVLTLGLSFISLFWGCFLVAALRPGLVGSMMQARWLRWIGGISYGIYVYHVLLAVVFARMAEHLVPSGNRNVTLGLTFAITVVGSIAVAWVSFHLVENPILKLRKRFQSKPVQPVAA